MHFTAAFGAGLLLGLANWAFWESWGRSFLSKEKGAKQGLIVLLSLFKLGIVAGIIWFLLVKLALNPIGFLLGFSIMTLLFLKKFK